MHSMYFALERAAKLTPREVEWHDAFWGLSRGAVCRLWDAAAMSYALRCAQVRAYSRVFWERYTELNDYERITKNIERGEQRIQRQADIMAAIAAKLDRYRNPWQVHAGL